MMAYKSPVMYVLWNLGPARRWRKVGTVTTRAEATALSAGPGDWLVAPLSNPDLAGSAAHPVAAFVLWCRRAGRRSAWEPVVTCSTEAECYKAIGDAGRRNGSWLVLPAGQQP